MTYQSYIINLIDDIFSWDGFSWVQGLPCMVLETVIHTFDMEPAVYMSRI